MNLKMDKVKNIVLPYKRINYFIIGLAAFGIISGAIFFTVINIDNKIEISKQIQSFFVSINNNSIDCGLAFKNALFSNGLLIIIIWILGMSVIGMLINIFVIYIKSFVVGFGIASIIGTYGFKGLLASLVYVFPQQLLFLFAISIMSIYSIIFSIHIVRLIFKKSVNNNRNMIKKYMFIFVFVLVIIFIASLLEAYLLPSFMKLIIKLYI